jgi:signal transduction histidine kinase
MATILIADDQATNRDFLVTLLGYAGHRIVEAIDGVEALAMVRAEQPDLVIADIVMPCMDGFELVRNLRTDPLFAPTRVIFCTATYLEDEARDLARACGVVHVLIKPVEPQMVLDVVKKELGGHAPTPAAALTGFEREHLGLVTNKLVEKVAELEALNAELERRVEARTAELATANARLREINALKDKFVAVTSHDLRSPLAAIQNMVEIMLEEADTLPEDPHRRFLGHIYDSTKHLTRLVTRLLDLADLESGRVQLEAIELYAGRVAEQAIESLRASAEAKDIALLLVVEPAEQPIAADWMKLSQIVGNLIGNAIKFTPAGGQITVTVASSPAEARISVADTGVGIPAEMLSQLFEKSHLAHTRGTIGERGTGLGLTIVSELAALHGGRVEVTSEVGRGSAFTVHLPAGMER